MLPLLSHPPFTSFPIALLVVALCVETLQVFSVRFSPQVQRVLLSGALLGGVAAFISGIIESQGLSLLSADAEHTVSLHYELARLMLLGSFLTLFFFELMQRSRDHHGRARLLFRIALCATVLLALYAGANGGRLVFDYGVGVRGP